MTECNLNYRLVPNNLPKVKIGEDICDYSVKPSNIFYGKDTIKNIPWAYFDQNNNEINGKSNVEIIYTHIDPWIRRNVVKDLGYTEFGRHYGKNLGISFVRDGREIDFGKKGFFADGSDPTNRFIGVELRFPPTLDKLFGVSNTKQSVRFYKTKDSDYKIGQLDTLDLLKEMDIQSFYKREISNSITANISAMKLIVDKQTAGKRSGGKIIDPTQKAVDKVIENSMAETLARLNKNSKTKEEIIREAEEKLKEDYSHLPDKELKDLVNKYGKHEVIIEELPWPGEIFIECSVVGSAYQVKINTRHKFYLNIYKPLQEKNPDAWFMLRILLFSYGQATQELTSDEEQEHIENLNSKWGSLMQRFAKSLEELDSDVK